MRTSILTISSLALLASCSSQPTSSQPGATGGKADTPALGAEEFRCQVVRVVDDSVLEEGLGSIYDFDEDGFFEVDGDSHEVSIQKSEFGEHESGTIISIGQLSFGVDDAGDVLERIEETPRFNDDTEFVSFRARRANDDREFKIRIFTQNNLGIVFFKEGVTPDCHSDALNQCEGACGESTTTIEEEFACAEECPAEVEAQCGATEQLALIDCRIESPEGLF